MSKGLFANLLIGAILVAISGMVGSVSPAYADDSCDQTTSIVPSDNSMAWSITPSCWDAGATAPIVVIPTGPSEIVTGLHPGTTIVSPYGGYGYTTPGNTPYVNGAPEYSPYSNTFQYTPAGAAAARASGNPSATGNAYSQYGGFTPPGNTATR